MSEEKRGCLKNGVLGCLGLLGIGIVVFGAMAGLAVLDSRRPVERVQEERSAPVPVQRAAEASPATSQQLEDARTAIRLTVPDDELPAPTIGTLELDLAAGDFTIVPSDGTEIEIEGDFDKTRYRLDEEMTEDDDGAWRYRIRFRARSRLRAGGNIENQLTIRVPRDLPLDLVGRIRMGTSDLELGGLSVHTVDLETEMGDHSVSFSEPTPRPITSFQITGRMGQLGLAGLGNASPSTIEARHQMGELDIGLTGAWRNDCAVTARWRMGQMDIDVDDRVRVEVVQSTVLLGGKRVLLPDPSELPADAPTLSLDLGGSMGEVVVR